MLKKFIFLYFIVAPLVLGKLLKVQDEGASFVLFDLKEVCAFYGKKDALMADKKNAKTIDCMGHEFKIQKFCDSKLSKDPMYTRARFDIAENKISCQKARATIVSLSCDKRDQKEYCLSPKNGCLKIKSDFARNHQLARSSLLESSPPVLKCYFSEKSDLGL